MRMMDHQILENYIEKIYKFSLCKTFSEDEADDLAQDILLTAVKQMPKLKDEAKFEPWLWGIAANVAKSFRRTMGKQRAMYTYNVPEDLLYEELLSDDDEELYSNLRTKISRLTGMYRDIIILYYYDGLSTKEIALRLGIPEGTVTWRLSEARRKLRKECMQMEETVLRPVQMKIDIYGSGDYNGKTRPFPGEFIKDALSQNILWQCYEQPRTVEELAKLCGVPAYYIEDSVANLVKRAALISPEKNKYRTDFVIYTDKYGQYCEENCEKALSGVMDKLIGALDGLYEEAGKLDFYRAGKSEEELKYLYGLMAFAYLSSRSADIEYPDVEPNYDGNRWRYTAYMESGACHRVGVGRQVCRNYKNTDRGNIIHVSYWLRGRGRQMMYSDYIDVCEELITKGAVENESVAANAIRDGYIARDENGKLTVTAPMFTTEQKKRFDDIVERLFGPVREEYVLAVRQFISGYKKLFPEHLQDDAQRSCRCFLLGFYDTVSAYSVKIGKLKEPQDGWCYDVIVPYDKTAR